MAGARRVIVVSGPNGAGKTTAATQLLRGALQVEQFVNADAIARGLSAFNPESVSLAAGRIMLEHLHDLAAQGADFAFETTLASRTFAPWIRRITQSGYRFHLIYIWLPNPEMAIARVAERVRNGGHFVPDETVRRRYHRGLRNFLHLYRPIAATWRVLDGTQHGGPRLIAYGHRQVTLRVAEQTIWDTIQQVTP